MKQCSKCKVSKELADFSKDSTRKDGHDPVCKTCKSAYQRERFRNDPEMRKKKAKQHRASVDRNREHVYAILQQSKCVDCGDARWQVLEFDHVKGQKRLGVCDMIRCGMSIQTIDAEIAKCEIRCANCHRLKTANQLGWWKSSEKNS